MFLCFQDFSLRFLELYFSLFFSTENPAVECFMSSFSDAKILRCADHIWSKNLHRVFNLFSSPFWEEIAFLQRERWVSWVGIINNGEALTVQTPAPHNVHTQTICRQFADDLFECVWPFCGVGA